MLAAGFGLGFLAHISIHSAARPDVPDELRAYRQHAAEVRAWEAWLRENAPYTVLPGGRKVPTPSAVIRGRAELSADYFWPRPEIKAGE